MPKNYFRENRLSIQKAFIKKGFLLPLSSQDLPFTIEETDAKSTLKEVRITNMPVSDVQPVSYVLDAEMAGEIFSAAPGISMSENILLILTKKNLHVVLIEMKSSLAPKTIRNLEKKIYGTVGRALMYFTHYLLDNEVYNECEIRFSTIVFYNEDWLTRELSANPNPLFDKTVDNMELVKIFQEQKHDYLVTEPLGQVIKVNVIYKQNPVNEAVFNFDFNELLAQTPDYSNAIIDLVTLP